MNLFRCLGMALPTGANVETFQLVGFGVGTHGDTTNGLQYDSKALLAALLFRLFFI